MFEFKSYDAGTRLKAKSLMAASLVGGGSGVVAALNGAGDMLSTVFLGMLLVLVGGHAGGFAGMMIRSVTSSVRRKGGSSGGGIDVIMPALSFGALVGLMFALIVANWKDAHLGAAVGAVLGGMAGGMAGESVGDMLNLITIVEGGGKIPRPREQGGRLDIVDFEKRDPDKK
jgi:hypothetical protein